MLGIDSQSNHCLLGQLEITYLYMVTFEAFHALTMIHEEFVKIFDTFITIWLRVIFVVTTKKK